MTATTDIKRTRWPRDLKAFALLSALWAIALTARIVMRETTASVMPLEAIAIGMRFEGFAAVVALAAQAMAISTMAIGLASEGRWGLWFAFIYLFEVVISRLVFMLTNLNDLAQLHNVRTSGFLGIGTVLLLLYLWIRASDLLFEEDPRATIDIVRS